MKALPFAENEKLRPIEEIPEWARPAFKGMKSLNRVQSRVYETALLSQRICYLRQLVPQKRTLLCSPYATKLEHRDPDTGEIDLTKFKIVYVAR